MEDCSWQLITAIWNEREAQRALAELEAFPPDGAQTAEMQAFFARNDAKLLRKLRRRISGREAKRLGLYAIRAAAAVVMCMGLIGGACYAASPEIREYVSHVALNNNGKGGNIYLTQTLEVPEEWNGNYYPTVLSYDMVLDEENCFFEWPSVTYRSEIDPEKRFYYAEDDMNTGIMVDTEDAEITNMLIRNCEGIVIEKGLHLHIFWNEGTNIYHVSARCFEKEEVLYYIECMEKVRRE